MNRIQFPSSLFACMAAALLLACRADSALNYTQVTRAQLLCNTNCYGVSVTPDGDFVRFPSSGGDLSFEVTNTGLVSATYGLTCYGTGSLVCTGITDSSVTLDPNQATDVTAYFHGFGRLVLKANVSAVSDTGWYKVFPQL
jgi:hypothetical protein